LAGCCECGDKPPGSGAMELVGWLVSFFLPFLLYYENRHHCLCMSRIIFQRIKDYRYVWYGLHVTRGHTTFELLNFLLSVLVTWCSCKLLRCEQYCTICSNNFLCGMQTDNMVAAIFWIAFSLWCVLNSHHSHAVFAIFPTEEGRNHTYFRILCDIFTC
jgi:hypothetical protein